MGSGTDRPNHDIVAHPDGVEDLELVVWERGVNVPQYGFDPLPPRRSPMIGAVLGQDLYSLSDVPAVQGIVVSTNDRQIRVRIGHDSLPLATNRIFPQLEEHGQIA